MKYLYSRLRATRRSRRGVTLVEVMVAASILSISILAFVGAFQYISKSIRVSRARMLAVNLAQEKIENLKNNAYYKVQLTTTSAVNNDFSPPVYYDTVNYPLETITIGGINFLRGVYVSMTYPDENQIIWSTGADYPDTGLKWIEVIVMWKEGNVWKKLSLNNVYENTVVNPLTANVKGRATLDGSVAIDGVVVTVLENPDWTDTAGTNGSYNLAAQPGAYSLRASSAGYYDATVADVSLTTGTSVTVNFQLQAIATGSVSGNIWLNTGLVISQVVTATSTEVGECGTKSVEYIELFNPTTYAINIGVTGGAKAHKVNYYDEDGGGDNKTDAQFDFTHIATYVPAGRYYLISNASFFFISDGWINADAHYYDAGCAFNNYLSVGEAGTVELVRAADNVVVDTLGWADDDDNAPYKEGTQIPDAGGGFCPDGPGDGNQFVRISSPATAISTYGRAYDSNNNKVDFNYPAMTCIAWASASEHYFYWAPTNSTTTAKPVITGKPAIGADITAADLLGPATRAYTVNKVVSYGAVGNQNVPYAYFQLNGVSTGTWSVLLASGAYRETIDDVVVDVAAETSIPNAATSPVWRTANHIGVSMDTQTTGGYVTGVVKAGNGTALSNINVLAGGSSKITGSNGRYFAEVSTGTVILIVNPNNSNSAYVENIETLTVGEGEVVTANVTLIQGGIFQGYITTDGNSILPNIMVTASQGGVEYGSGTSDSSGNFYIRNLTTGTYVVAPVMDPMDTYSPLSLSSAVVQGQTVFIGTFTITGATGKLTGTITKGGARVTTGALILASTATLPASPVAIVASSAPAQSVIYGANSKADGTYEIEVRGSTVTKYNLSVYVPVLAGAGVTISTITYSNVEIHAATSTSKNLVLP